MNLDALQKIQTQLDHVNGQIGLLKDLYTISKDKGYIDSLTISEMCAERVLYKDSLFEKGSQIIQDE